MHACLCIHASHQNLSAPYYECSREAKNDLNNYF